MSASGLPQISIVIPVYQGASTLPHLVDEVHALRSELSRSSDSPFEIAELILVHDSGPDRSDEVLRELEKRLDYVSVVWLSRNFGQHAATLAGMASSRGDWIVTLDEDGQHDPNEILSLFEAAMVAGSDVVYAKPSNPPPHSRFRNWASKTAKRILSALVGSSGPLDFQSFRLIRGSIARSVAAFSGPQVYLDVALGWFTTRVVTAPVHLREEGNRTSGYSSRRLLSHFWRMVLTSGTRGLRGVSIMGVLFATSGLLFAFFVVVQRIATNEIPEGWTSLIVILLVSTGVILFSLGIVAEYVGVLVGSALGKPAYLIIEDRKKVRHTSQ